jgi:hypothetical protein
MAVLISSLIFRARSPRLCLRVALHMSSKSSAHHLCQTTLKHCIPRVNLVRAICRMEHLINSVSVVHNITITDHRDTQGLLEGINPGKICSPGERLFISTTVHSDEVRPSVLKSFTELNEEIVIFPSEASFDGDRDFDSLAHFFYNFKCRIAIDHEG